MCILLCSCINPDQWYQSGPALSLFFSSCPQRGQGIRSSTSQPRRPPLAEGKKDEGAGDPIKILLEDALEKQRNAMMDNFDKILQWLPTGGTSKSNTKFNKISPPMEELNAMETIAS